MPNFFIAFKEFKTSSDSKRLDIFDIPTAIEASKTHLIDILLSEVTSIFFFIRIYFVINLNMIWH